MTKEQFIHLQPGDQVRHPTDVDPQSYLVVVSHGKEFVAIPTSVARTININTCAEWTLVKPASRKST